MKPKLVAILATLSLLAACGDEAVEQKRELRDIAQQFLPSDAADVVEATELAWTQLSFHVVRPGNASAIGPEQLRRAKENGWGLCAPNTADWTIYEDRSVSPPRERRQKVALLHKGDALVIVVSATSEELPRVPTAPPASPSDPIEQTGMVIVRRTSDQDISETAKAYKLTCGSS